MSKPFDPREHLRLLDNGATYLDVKWRVHWIRSEHADAQIETEMISIDDERAVCKAIVRIPGGGTATGHASATRSASSAFIETAETRAIGRALAALGYGAEFVEDDQPVPRPVERPVSLVPSQPSPPLPPTSAPSSPRVRPVRTLEERLDVAPTEDTVAPHDAPEESEPKNLDAVLNDLPTPMTRGSELRPHGDTPTRSPGREDISWNKFWEWAKPRGYRDGQHLKDLLGIDVAALTPGEIRAHIRRYELEHPPESDPS